MNDAYDYITETSIDNKIFQIVENINKTLIPDFEKQYKKLNYNKQEIFSMIDKDLKNEKVKIRFFKTSKLFKKVNELYDIKNYINEKDLNFFLNNMEDFIDILFSLQFEKTLGENLISNLKRNIKALQDQILTILNSYKKNSTNPLYYCLDKDFRDNIISTSYYSDKLRLFRSVLEQDKDHYIKNHIITKLDNKSVLLTNEERNAPEYEFDNIIQSNLFYFNIPTFIHRRVTQSLNENIFKPLKESISLIKTIIKIYKNSSKNKRLKSKDKRFIKYKLIQLFYKLDSLIKEIKKEYGIEGKKIPFTLITIGKYTILSYKNYYKFKNKKSNKKIQKKMFLNKQLSKTIKLFNSETNNIISNLIIENKKEKIIDIDTLKNPIPNNTTFYNFYMKICKLQKKYKLHLNLSIYNKMFQNSYFSLLENYISNKKELNLRFLFSKSNLYNLSNFEIDINNENTIQKYFKRLYKSQKRTNYPNDIESQSPESFFSLFQNNFYNPSFKYYYNFLMKLELYFQKYKISDRLDIQIDYNYRIKNAWCLDLDSFFDEELHNLYRKNMKIWKENPFSIFNTVYESYNQKLNFSQKIFNVKKVLTSLQFFKKRIYLKRLNSDIFSYSYDKINKKYILNNLSLNNIINETYIHNLYENYCISKIYHHLIISEKFKIKTNLFHKLIDYDSFDLNDKQISDKNNQLNKKLSFNFNIKSLKELKEEYARK